jgi:ribonuclease HII
VYAAAVLLDTTRPVAGLKDSKLLAPARREALAQAIRDRALVWAVASASVEEIDRLNILQATLLAMRRAVEGLAVRPHEAWIDGNRCPALDCAARAIVRGDRTVPQISAASILAKTARDAEMLRLHARYPQYLSRHGACDIHRRSFAPVREALRA